MKKWEYKRILLRKLSPIPLTLNRFGEEGWEVVHISDKLTYLVEIFLKRELVEKNIKKITTVQ